MELEHSIVYRIIEPSSCIVLESYFLFKLFALKRKWQDLCNVANDNELQLIRNETFLNLLKFLIENLDFKTNTLILSFVDGCALYEEEQTETQIWLSLPKTKIELICLIIDIAPQKIVIHSNNLHNKTEKLVMFLFNDNSFS